MDGSISRDIVVVCIISEVVYCPGQLQEETGHMKCRALTDMEKDGGGLFKGILANGHWRGMACPGEYKQDWMKLRKGMARWLHTGT